MTDDEIREEVRAARKALIEELKKTGLFSGTWINDHFMPLDIGDIEPHG